MTSRSKEEAENMDIFFFYEAAKTIANIILVHQNEVSGPNTASTINTLTINICGSKWRKENTRAAGAKRESKRSCRD